MLQKMYREIPYTLHPASPNGNILYNQSMISKSENWCLYNPPTLFNFYQCYMHSFVCVCVCACSSRQFYHMCRYKIVPLPQGFFELPFYNHIHLPSIPPPPCIFLLLLFPKSLTSSNHKSCLHLYNFVVLRMLLEWNDTAHFF